MSTCAHRYDGDGLPCTRTDPHDPEKRGGHVYVSESGSWVDDRHEGDGGHG